jgi:hypothetical protein
VKVASSGEATACTLLERGSACGGEGVTARMVECAVDGRAGVVGVGGARRGGRKCVDVDILGA